MDIDMSEGQSNSVHIQLPFASIMVTVNMS